MGKGWGRDVDGMGNGWVGMGKGWGIDGEGMGKGC